MHSTTASDRGLVDVAVVLVGVQAAILATSTIEALVSATFLGPAAAGPVFLSGAAALATASTAVGLGRRARWARSWTLVAEGAVLTLATLDVVALPFLTAGDPALASFLTRVVTPIAVIALLRRAPVRAAFAETAA